MKYLLVLVLLLPLVGIADNEIDRAQLETIENQERLESAADHLSSLVYVDLNVPENFDAVRRVNPNNYKKIQRILSGIQKHSIEDVPSWMEVNFEARNVIYNDLLKTSYPPLKRLSFSLDKTLYVVEIIVEGSEPVLEPAE